MTPIMGIIALIKDGGKGKNDLIHFVSSEINIIFTNDFVEKRTTFVFTMKNSKLYEIH